MHESNIVTNLHAMQEFDAERLTTLVFLTSDTVSINLYLCITLLLQI